MKVSELRQMSGEQLQSTLNEAADTLFRLRVKSQTEKLTASSDLKKNRQIIARIKTIQTERVLAGQASKNS
jgi:large subunit ribosomal protein L29